MTLTVLASVSLLVLVSSASPLVLPQAEKDAWKSLQVSGSGDELDSNMQHVVEAVVKSHASSSEDIDLKEDEDVHVQLTTSEELQAYLSNADVDAIKALIPLSQNEVHSPDEKELIELLNRLEAERTGRSSASVPDDALDFMESSASASSDIESMTDSAEVSSEGSTSEREKEASGNAGRPNELFTSTPILVMAISCAVAMVAICCIAIAVYLVEMLRKTVYRSAYSILPQLEKQVLSHTSGTGSRVGARGRYEVIEGGSTEPSSDFNCKSEKEAQGEYCISIANAIIRPGPQPVPSRTVIGTIPLPKIVLPDDSSNGSDTGDELDEKFFDAEGPDADDSTGPHTAITTSNETEKPQLSALPPPGLPALAAATATFTAVTVAHPLQDSVVEIGMREMSSELASIPGSYSPSPSYHSPRPPWSVRAQEAGALIHAHELRDELQQQERRYQRAAGSGKSAAPQIDAALAMQLRPGLGIGADAAWLVRFVMALFGWCAVLMSGGTWALLS